MDELTMKLKGKPVVVCDTVRKQYGETLALDDISFSVDEGEIFGLIGPDGAGKTSLFRILTTLIFANGGEASIDGYDVVNDYRMIRNSIGYMPGKFSLYQDLSVEENLKFFASVFNTTIEENFYLIKDIYTQIEPFKTRKAGALSGGMKQKLALSCALVHKPKVLFLDEPTTGVDPVSRKEFWQMLKKLKEEKITIVVSTPYMDEAVLCDRIALIQKGKFLTIDTPENIVNRYEKPLWAVAGTPMAGLLSVLRQNEATGQSFAFGDSIHVAVSKGDYSIDDLKKYLIERGFADFSIEPVKATIEDCFMALSNNPD